MKQIQMMKGIRVHAPGSRLTDYQHARLIESAAPLSFRKAQDVLAAVNKYVNKKGFFSTDASRAQALKARIEELAEALDHERFLGGLAHKPSGWGMHNYLFQYLSQFSDAFPNWQEEYKALTRFITDCYSNKQSQNVAERPDSHDTKSAATACNNSPTGLASDADDGTRAALLGKERQNQDDLRYDADEESFPRT